MCSFSFYLWENATLGDSHRRSVWCVVIGDASATFRASAERKDQFMRIFLYSMCDVSVSESDEVKWLTFYSANFDGPPHDWRSPLPHTERYCSSPDARSALPVVRFSIREMERWRGKRMIEKLKRRGCRNNARTSSRAQHGCRRQWRSQRHHEM